MSTKDEFLLIEKKPIHTVEVVYGGAGLHKKIV